MKEIAFLSGLISGLFLGISSATAQITSDNTTNTTVNQSGKNYNIINGIQKGNNLFHSFKEFSIPKGGSATFNNSTDIVNIINRVTGGNISNIDGLIKANGNANLFLINPAGIVFGENARLNIGGSFFGSTAESILFKDGFEFKAVNAQEKPLLTISVPVGLQMGVNPGAIEVNGTGHNLIAQDATASPYINLGSANFLQVNENQTLALVGGDIQLNGAILTAEGRVELASIKQGRVNLADTSKGSLLDNSKISNFGNIQLAQRTLIDVSGKGAGEVNIVGDRLNIIDGSVVMVQNRGIQTAGDINLQAKSILLSGGIADTQIRSSLINETIAGDSGNININTDRLSILDGAGVFTRTFSLGNSGSIDINATESVDIIGVSAINPSQYSVIASNTFSRGNTGNIKLSTKNLSVLNSGIISATTFNNGSAGNITINSENTQVAGKSQGVFRVTAIAGVTFGEGDAGSLTFNTQTLSVRDGASIATTSYNSGNSGSITVNATKSIETTGGNEIQAANINSSVLSDSSPLAQLLGLPLLPSGNAGDITLNTPYLKLSDYGGVSVRNAGKGNAGTLKINADLIKIENQAGLAARSNSTGGGDIFVQADSLQMRRNSYINTDTRGEGNGGNITIDTNTLVALENSDISANAQNSFGGKVTINAQGIFGTQFRGEQTIESDITATSELGAEFSGVVELNTPGIDPSSGISELPENLTDSSNQIASGCSSNTGNSFVATGKGGISKNPNEQLDANLTWSDIRDLSAFRQKNNIAENTQILNKPAIVEATGFIRNSSGQIELVAVGNKPAITDFKIDCNGYST